MDCMGKAGIQDAYGPAEIFADTYTAAGSGHDKYDPAGTMRLPHLSLSIP